MSRNEYNETNIEVLLKKFNRRWMISCNNESQSMVPVIVIIIQYAEITKLND